MSKQLAASAPTHAAPSISLLLTNLHLLDLDTRNDWPSLTAQTFTSKNTLQNEKTRIQCVEWAFYRLFEIWDPAETKDVRPCSYTCGLSSWLTVITEAHTILSCSRSVAISESTCCPFQMPERAEKEWDTRKGCDSQEDIL